MTKLRDIDGLKVSPSRLNSEVACTFLYMFQKVIGAKPDVPRREFKMNFGTENHEVDENFWNLMKAKGKHLFGLSFLKTCSKEELAKPMTDIKRHFIPTHKRPMMMKPVHNMSLMDAQVFIDLRKHFDGDVKQLWEYWIPLELEYEVTDEVNRVHMILDNLSKVPAKFKRYRNKEDSLIVKDLKPGKFNPDGTMLKLQKNSDYDYGNFGRQLVFYSYYIDYLGMPCHFVAGKYYKTGQYIVDKLNGHQISPFEKHISNFWDLEKFHRRAKWSNWKEDKYGVKRDVDRCAWCDYRLQCRNTQALAEGDDNGGFVYLEDLVDERKCTSCGEDFIVFQRVEREICHKCELEA